MRWGDRIGSRSVVRGIFVLILAGGYVTCAAQGIVDDPTEVFRTGNSAYEAGEYPTAIDAYRRLVDAGVENADLYFNLGNAYYKNNVLGNSVLFYLRSLRVQLHASPVDLRQREWGWHGSHRGAGQTRRPTTSRSAPGTRS